MARKVVVYRDYNETCAFYFESLIGSGRPGYALMDVKRMNEIFDQCMDSDQLSTFIINKIKKWKKENGYD